MTVRRGAREQLTRFRCPLTRDACLRAAVATLTMDWTLPDEFKYFWNPAREWVFVQVSRTVNTAGTASVLLKTVDFNATAGVHYENSTTMLTFEDGAEYPNEFQPNGNMTIVLFPEAVTAASNGSAMYVHAHFLQL